LTSEIALTLHSDQTLIGISTPEVDIEISGTADTPDIGVAHLPKENTDQLFKLTRTDIEHFTRSRGCMHPILPWSDQRHGSRVKRREVRGSAMNDPSATKYRKQHERYRGPYRIVRCDPVDDETQDNNAEETEQAARSDWLSTLSRRLPPSI
jgi:hypothetical protein